MVLVKANVRKFDEMLLLVFSPATYTESMSVCESASAVRT